MDQPRTTLGTISILIPPGWAQQPDDGAEARRWLVAGATPGSPAGLVVVQTVGALPAGGPTIDARLRAAAQALGAAAGVEVAGEARRVVLGTVPALMILGRGVLAAALLVAGKVTLLVAAWANEQGFKAIDAAMSSLRPALPVVTPPPLGAAGGVSIVGADVPFLRAWSPDGPSCAPNRGAWWVPQRLVGVSEPVKYGAVLEAQPRCPLSPRLALLRFARAAAEVLGRKWTRASKVEVTGQSDFAFPDGTLGATVIIDEKDGGALVTRCMAHARATPRGTFFVATATGPWSAGWQQAPAGTAPERIWERVDDVADALLTILAEARPRPLPEVAAAATARLLERGRWTRRTEWSHSSSTPSLQGFGSFSAYSSGHTLATWTFRPDGTCDIETDETSSVSCYDSYVAPASGDYRTDWALSGLTDEPETRRTRRFEVREPAAPGGPHLIVVTDPAGVATFHTLELEAAGRYGDRETKGVAIDGEIEGTYKASSGSLGDFKVWTPA